MTDSNKHTRIIIIGAGISGLSAAHRLLELHQQGKKEPLDITIIDSRDRIGGVIHTIERDGFLIDTGPDNFVTAKPWALALAGRLGLESEVIPTNESHRSAMVVRKGKMLPIPEGFLLMAPTKLMPIVTTPLFSLPGKLRMGLEWFLPPRKSEQDESLASFVSRRFGREALDRVVQPLISGIYTAPPEKLSLSATMPRFLELEKKYGSVIKGMRAAGKKQKQTGSGARYGMFVTFRNGLQTLVHGLRARLGHVDFRLGQAVISVDKGHAKNASPLWQVCMGDGNILEAQGVVIAGPSRHAAALLKKTDPELAEQLSSIAYASSAVVHLAYRRDQISHPLDSFGCVVPIVERKNIIAASFSSVKYPGRAPDGFVLLRAFMGGAIHPNMIDRDDDALVTLARQDLDQLLGIVSRPLFSVVSRWPHSMAQYEVGHLAKAAAIRARIGLHKGLGICGNGFEGVGIPDCIHAGEKTAEELMNDMGHG